jgi:hypothetical protein
VPSRTRFSGSVTSPCELSNEIRHPARAALSDKSDDNLRQRSAKPQYGAGGANRENVGFLVASS